MSNTLSPNDEKFIRQFGRTIEVKEGSFIFQEGDQCNAFLLSLSGSIRVQKVSDSGRMIVLYRVDPNNVCILTTSCLIGNKSYEAEGISETPVKALVLDKAHFKQLMDQSSDFREFIFASLSDRLSSLIMKINDVVLSSLDHRLASYLLKLAKGKNPISITHQEIANELGTAREVISRLLKQFATDGLIELGHGHIEIVNTEGIQALTHMS